MTNAPTCHACGQELPGEANQQEEDGLTREKLKAMSQAEVKENWSEVSKFLKEEQR